MRKLTKLFVAIALLAVLTAPFLFIANALLADLPDIAAIEAAKRAVVRVSILGGGTCTATVVSPTHAITAAHCIPSMESFMSYLLQGKPPIFFVGSMALVYPQSVFGKVDAATLKGNFSGLAKATNVDNTLGRVFHVEKAVLCGYPLYSSTLRCEVARRVSNIGFYAKFDTVSIPGQSGGAVFALDGQLIGTISAVDQYGHTIVSSTTGVLSLSAE
jgi:V8-like Glu-specific endopeptidase